VSTFKNEVLIAGVVQQQLPQESGVSKSGKQWTKSSSLINTGDKDPVVVSAFNQTAQVLGAIPAGTFLNVIGKISTRNWEGKYYVDLRITSVFPVDQAGAPAQNAAVSGYGQPPVVDHQQGVQQPVTGAPAHHDAPVGRDQPTAFDDEKIPF